MNLSNVIRFVGDWAGTAALATTITVAACSHSQPPQQTAAQKSAAADATYFADRAACRDKVKYPTVEQSDACAEASRKRWHRLPDGGADGTYADGGL